MSAKNPDGADVISEKVNTQCATAAYPAVEITFVRALIDIRRGSCGNTTLDFPIRAWKK